MKKLIMIAIAFLTLNATAQDRKKKNEFFKDLTAEEVATLKTKKMTLHLDLTESQQTQVKALILEETKHQKKQRVKFEERKEKENTQKPSKEERLTMMNEQLDRKIEMKKNMKNILNAEQYEKWESTLAKKGKRKQKKRSQR